MLLVKQLFVLSSFSLLITACGGDDNHINVYVDCDGDLQTQEIDGDSLQIQCDSSSDQDDDGPTRTTNVAPEINLDASAEVIEVAGRLLTTEGVAIGVAQAGLQSATTTTLAGNIFTLPLPNDFSSTSMDFDVGLAGQGENIGTVSISLDVAAGVPSSVNTFNDLRVLASVVNTQIFSPSGGQLAIDVSAEALDLGGGNFAIAFTANDEGLASTISLSNLTVNTAQIGLSGPVPTSTSGIPRVDNGYPAQAVEISLPDASSVIYNAGAGHSARATAAGLDALEGVSATAQTEITISGFTSTGGNLNVTVNSVLLAGETLTALETEINALSNTTLPGFSASLNEAGASLQLVSEFGDDIEVSISSVDDGDSVTVVGNPLSSPLVLEADPIFDGVTASTVDAETNSIVVGGVIEIVFDGGYDMLQPTIQGLIQPLSPTEFSDVVFNSFSPSNAQTYNFSTSTTIYDSLGLEHQLSLYFVVREYDANDPTSIPNHWHLHALVDGFNVGDPDTTLPPPQNAAATPTTYDIYFDESGAIDLTLSDSVLVSNWVPMDVRGEPNGAAGPQNVLAGGVVPIPNPPTSSNFVIDIEGLTQFGSESVVFGIEQNGASGL